MAKTKLKLTVRVTKAVIKKAWAGRWNGGTCPLAVALSRALGKRGRGWASNWVTWASAEIVKTRGRKKLVMTAYFTNEDISNYHQIRWEERWEDVKPFTLDLTFKA